MKILHTSDWHLGKRLESFSRMEEQEAVLKEICDIADKEKVHAVIISGDLFDTFNPSTDAVELFYKYTKRLANNGKRAVIAIAGNHDSPERIEAPDPLARECGIIFSGFPHTIITPFNLEAGLKVLRSEKGFIELQIPDISYPLRLIHTPYANELRMKTYLGNEETEEELRTLLNKHWDELAEKYCTQTGVNILASHLLFVRTGDEIPEEPEEEKPILFIGGAQAIPTQNIPGNIQYVALGHLHRKRTIDIVPCPVIYSGSPLSYSFGEADQNKFVNIVEITPGEKALISAMQLESGKKLIRKRFEIIDEVVEWLAQNPDVYIELTIVSDTYLTATDRKRLLDAHNGIVAIIPEIRNLAQTTCQATAPVDLTKSMEELFIDFFKAKKGQEPNERIINLFKEAISEEGEL
ncbi:MAG: exonuclease subunit SbcD [Bacteroidia bacterium]|nr:exonuclease subunit SbcD [Bacteroidia bacterium]